MICLALCEVTRKLVHSQGMFLKKEKSDLVSKGSDSSILKPGIWNLGVEKKRQARDVVVLGKNMLESGKKMFLSRSFY